MQVEAKLERERRTICLETNDAQVEHGAIPLYYL